ncbi:MAG: ATP-binding protein, partial [Eubacteriales bacterium]
LFFRTDGYLYDETRNLLIQEFSDTVLVNNVIEQIASGKNTLNTIAGAIGEKEQSVLYSLQKLIGIGLVEKIKCITEEKNKKKTGYVLKDHMFAFWYKFIPKATSLIEIGQGELYYKNAVKPLLHMFMGTVFEDMCRYYMLRQGALGKFGCFITKVGKWWGNEQTDGEERTVQSADIDVVGLAPIEKKAIIGECKFKNEKTDRGVYETLIRRANVIEGKYKIAKYVLFSLAGYTKWFDDSQDERLILLTLEDLYCE